MFKSVFRLCYLCLLLSIIRVWWFVPPASASLYPLSSLFHPHHSNTPSLHHSTTPFPPTPASIRQSRHLRYFAGQSWEACEDGGMVVKTDAQNQKSEGKIEERGGSVAPIDNRLYRRLATSSVCRQSRIRASADYQSAISRLEVGTASWRYDAGRTRSAGGPNPEIAQVCPGLPGFDRLWPGKVSSVRRAGCGRIPVNRESANTAIYRAKPCVQISNQPIRSHINLINFLPAMPIFHNLCLFRNEFIALRRVRRIFDKAAFVTTLHA